MLNEGIIELLSWTMILIFAFEYWFKSRWIEINIFIKNYKNNDLVSMLAYATIWH